MSEHICEYVRAVSTRTMQVVRVVLWEGGERCLHLPRPQVAREGVLGVCEREGREEAPLVLGQLEKGEVAPASPGR